MKTKLDYILKKIHHIKKIQILELGVQRGVSTKNEENPLNEPKRIKSREFGIKNLLRKIYKRKPVN